MGKLYCKLGELAKFECKLDELDKLYVGHPINSDNGLISQKLLLKSEFYYPLHVAIGVAYSCLKYGVFIIT